LVAVWAGATIAPWAFAHVLTGGCLLVLYLLLAGMERRTDLARLAGATLSGTAAAVGGWLGDALPHSLHLEGARFTALIATAVAGASALMAAVAAWGEWSAAAAPTSPPSSAERPAGPWFTVLPAAWR